MILQKRKFNRNRRWDAINEELTQTRIISYAVHYDQKHLKY